VPAGLDAEPGREDVQQGLAGGAVEGGEATEERCEGFSGQRGSGLAEREAAKAAELAAAGEPGSVRNLRRLRQRYERQGLWGLVDHRATRLSREFGRVDERVVGAVAEAMEEQADDSTGTRKRAWRRAQEILSGRYPGQEVPLPSTASVYRLFAAMEGGRHTFGSAVRRRSNANRPATPFTASTAQRPGEIVQTDTTPLDVMAVFDDGVLGRPELTITLDVATRTIGAAVLRPAGTKAVDAAVLVDLSSASSRKPIRPRIAASLWRSADALG
jgi:putative transposase